ncbi:cellulase family glycosylhydrolase [Marinilabiliaceae bacterium N1Y90]|nr:cellulase family glycosylhydrolase [Marinilabiliaceae bacterium N1Y90]
MNILIITMLALIFSSCSESNGGEEPPEPTHELSVEPTNISAFAEGSESNISIKSNTTWRITYDNSSFFRPSITTAKGDATVKITIDENQQAEERNGTLTIIDSDETLEEIIITINQEAGEEVIDPEIPDYIEPDMTGVESTASELANKMIVGWNIGNSLEVPGGETGWGNPKVSETLIQGVKDAGFNAIRIPCAWDSYLENQEDYTIKESWLQRVKEVVDCCVSRDMYAIINIHWDGGWLEEHPMYEHQDAVNEKQAAIWKQIAKYFRDYNEHLMFAGTNEVRENYGNPSTENIEVQESYVQTFVDAVRATGGRNTYRNLVVQTYNTNIDHGVNYHTMPSDDTENRLIVEAHYYDPYEFTIKTDEGYKTQWGEGYTDVTDWGQEDHLEAQFQKLKTKYIDNNIPVIIGEYSAMLRGDMPADQQALHEASRNYYHQKVNEIAKANGITTFYWDNGYTDKDASGLFNRSTGEQVHTEAIEAIINVYN